MPVAELLPVVFTSGWASGINPYLVVFLTGLLGRLTDAAVPDALTRTDVLVVCGVLTAVDFVADKVPFVDSTWDAVNTVVRPTIGAALGLLLADDTTTLQQALYAALGGSTAFASHAVKSGLRLAVNTSPEPVSTIGVSLSEDLTVAVVVALAFAYPWAAAGIAAALLITGVTTVVLLWRVVARRRADRRQARLRRSGPEEPPPVA